jgi:hypothetical protein
MINCSSVRFRDNRVLCEGLNQLIAGQEDIKTALDAGSGFFSIMTPESVWFFLGVICAVVFIQGVKLRL